jgi:hypothetical protein
MKRSKYAEIWFSHKNYVPLQHIIKVYHKKEVKEMMKRLFGNMVAGIY